MSSFAAKSLLWLAVCATLFALFRMLDRPADVSDAIAKLANDPSVSELHLKQATGFQWDYVVLFPPYTPRKKVCAMLFIPSDQCDQIIHIESRDDNTMTMAFTTETCLIRYVRHDRKNGNFQPLTAPRVLSAQHATFAVQRSDAWPTLLIKEREKKASLH